MVTKLNMGGSPVVVTGAAGFLGRAVMRRLIAAGHEDILACDVLAKPRDPAFRDVVWFGRSLYDSDNVWTLIRGCDPPPTHVYHCAGVTGTVDLQSQPALAVAHNVMATAWLLEAMAGVDPTPHLVYASKPDAWRNVYSATKRCADELCTVYDRDGRVPSARLRFFNLYGEDQPLGPVRRLVPASACLGQFGRPVQVYGTGRQTVCLTHVDDAAEAMVRAGRVRFRGHSDVGRGCQDVESVARLIAGHFGVPVEYLPMRPGEDHYCYIDARPADALTAEVGKLPDRDWGPGVLSCCEAVRRADPALVKHYADLWHAESPKGTGAA